MKQSYKVAGRNIKKICMLPLCWVPSLRYLLLFPNVSLLYCHPFALQPPFLFASLNILLLFSLLLFCLTLLLAPPLNLASSRYCTQPTLTPLPSFPPHECLCLPLWHSPLYLSPSTWSWWAWRLDAAGPTLLLRCRCGASWLIPAILPRNAAWCWFAQRKLSVWRNRRQRTSKTRPVLCECSWRNTGLLIFSFSKK